MSMETDALSYTGADLDDGRTAVYEDADAATAEPVAQYRNALAEAARQGKLSDETGAELASRYLGLSAASVSATALILLERSLHTARTVALGWSNGKSDQSSEVLIIERLAQEAAEKVRADLIVLTY